MRGRLQQEDMIQLVLSQTAVQCLQKHQQAENGALLSLWMVQQLAPRGQLEAQRISKVRSTVAARHVQTAVPVFTLAHAAVHKLLMALADTMILCTWQSCGCSIIWQCACCNLQLQTQGTAVTTCQWHSAGLLQTHHLYLAEICVQAGQEYLHPTMLSMLLESMITSVKATGAGD